MPGARIEGTRELILAILRRRGEAAVRELAEEIGLAGATVRRHLDVLLRDGHVAVEQERGRTGRPRYVFSLTEAGTDLFPHHYVRLTHRLVDEIVSLDARETEGQDGEALARLVFDRMSERLVREYAPRLRPGTLEARARRAAELLAEEGLDFEVTLGPEGDVRLLGRGCPCMRLGASARASSAMPSVSCAHDARLLSALLACEMQPLSRDDVAGAFLVGYRAIERPEPSPSEASGASRSAG